MLSVSTSTGRGAFLFSPALLGLQNCTTLWRMIPFYASVVETSAIFYFLPAMRQRPTSPSAILFSPFHCPFDSPDFIPTYFCAAPLRFCSPTPPSSYLHPPMPRHAEGDVVDGRPFPGGAILLPLPPTMSGITLHLFSSRLTYPAPVCLIQIPAYYPQKQGRLLRPVGLRIRIYKST